MNTPKIFESEYRFCTILWEHEPIGSTQLVKLCAEKLGWSKATTYTVIRRLSERGVVQNKDTIVTSLVSKEEAESAAIDEVVKTRFSGSLPSFIAAFTRNARFSDEELADLHRIIDEYGRGRQ